MDGFGTNHHVIVIAATNRADVLDKALVRAGRFDRQIYVDLPELSERKDIFKVHTNNLKITKTLDLDFLAKQTPGFSGADIANLCNEAALLAARKSKLNVGMIELEQAKDKVMMGAERRSMVMTEDEKKMTAYHEAGHALVMLQVEGHDPLHKVTIIPRGRALGVTMWLPERDKLSQTRTELEALIASMFGGRVAEELIYGKKNITTGAGNDIQQATNLARRMVMEFGFSDKLGPLRYETNQEEVFLGHSVAQQRNISDDTARLIDEEVRKLVEEGEKTSRKILTKHIEDLHKIAQGLLEYETLSAEDIDNILKGKELDKKNTNLDATSLSSDSDKSIKKDNIKNPRPNET